MRKKYLFVILVFACTSCKAQINTLGETYEEKFKYAVLSVSQFIDRYNYKLVLPTKDNKPAGKKYNLALLFDLSDTDFIASNEVHSFVDKYLTDSALAILNYEDSNWEASANTTFKFGDRLIKINLVLGIYPDSFGSKWLIKRVEYKDDLLEYCTNPIAKINPVNNEVNFSELSKAFTWKRNLTCYAWNLKPGRITSFLRQ